ncbi:MAG: nucleotidyltransferase domain-containing protein [Bacillota bacterium]
MRHLRGATLLGQYTSSENPMEIVSSWVAWYSGDAESPSGVGGRSTVPYRVADKETRRRRLTGELQRIVAILKGRGVEKIILFGSLASGSVGSASDIDLIVVEKTDKRFPDRLDEAYSAVQPRVAKDILVYTPEEIERLKESSSFVRQILREGIMLYEKGCE